MLSHIFISFVVKEKVLIYLAFPMLTFILQDQSITRFIESRFPIDFCHANICNWCGTYISVLLSYIFCKYRAPVTEHACFLCAAHKKNIPSNIPGVITWYNRIRIRDRPMFRNVFEHTCAYARWAPMHRLLSVRNWTKILARQKVTRSKFRKVTRSKFSDIKIWLIIMAVSNCNSRVKSISHDTGRCALFNFKLHF